MLLGAGLLAILVFVGAPSFTAKTAQPHDQVPKHAQHLKDQYVIAFGDSIMYQYGPSLQKAFEGHPEVKVDIHAFPGTNLCDWDQLIPGLLTKYHPKAVVLEFGGRSWTACMKRHGAEGSAEKFAYLTNIYHAAINTMLAAGVEQIQIIPLPTHNPSVAGKKIAIFNRLKAFWPTLASTFKDPRVLFHEAGRSVEKRTAVTPTISHVWLKSSLRLAIAKAQSSVESGRPGFAAP